MTDELYPAAPRGTIPAWGGVPGNKVWYWYVGDFVPQYRVEVHPDER